MYRTYKYFLELVFFTILFLSSPTSFGVNTDSQNMLELVSGAEQYLKMKFGNSSDSKVQIQVPEENLNLTDCKKLDFSTPSSNPGVNGNIRISVRCFSPQPWTIYLTARVSQKKIYYVNKVRLESGHIVGEADLVAKKDFPENIPFNTVSDPQQIIGKAVITIIEAGTPMIGTGLKNEYIINSGQTVKVAIGGSGFRINAEGKAMNNAAFGQNVQVKMASGQLISGIARSGGLVEVMK
jgi:flagellar basal body P-ring formation protein FlgA